MKRRIIGILAAVLTLCCFAGLASAAEIPFESYTYWWGAGTSGKDVYNRPMYEAELALDFAALGIEPFVKINGVSTDEQYNIYILDKESRIVIIDKDYNFIREIGAIGEERYDESSSVYISRDGTLYICDTLNHRVLHITAQGELLENITLPDSPLIPDNFDFRPTKATVDNDGYLYVLSDGSYYGALLYDTEKRFLGFFGSNKVSATISSVFTNISNRLFPNNAKKGNTAQKLPYCFVDIECDSEGFIYTCNGYTQAWGTGQIRKLSPGTGKNILGSEGYNFVDIKINRTYSDGAMSKQDIMNLEVDENGFIYALESAFGRIFLYDDDCRVLTAFGGGMGEGSQIGTFITVSGMTIIDNGSRVLVSDSVTNLITVFKITEYGQKVKDLIALTLDEDYAASKEGWQEVLTLDKNLQPAYSGLAKAYLDEGNYKKAMELSREGYDRETYSLAFEYYRKDFINKYFVLFFIMLILLAGAAVGLLILSMKKKLVFIKNDNLRLMASTMLHPAEKFTDIKEKKLGSIGLCFITVIIYYISTVLQTLKGGFLFNIYDAETFNSLWVFVRSAGLVVLWIVTNWMVCTLLGGKGRLREITIATCYSLWPLIIVKFLRLVLTNVLLPAEASFLSILDTVAMLYFLLMIVIGLTKIHDFSAARLIGTSILTLAGIGAIVFLIFMLMILTQQFVGFIMTLISEILTL